MTSYDYPDFLCTWLAADSNGNVGVFGTGGEGEVPIQMLPPLNDYDIHALLFEMPLVSSIRMVNQNAFSPRFEGLAERGLYVYNWYDLRREYFLMAEPMKPITREGLTQALRDAVPDLVLSRVSFKNALSIPIKRHVECVDW